MSRLIVRSFSVSIDAFGAGPGQASRLLADSAEDVAREGHLEVVMPKGRPNGECDAR